MDISHKLVLGFLVAGIVGGINVVLGYTGLMGNVFYAAGAITITVVVVLVIGLLASRSITGPISRLEAYVVEVGKGNPKSKLGPNPTSTT